MLRLQPDLLAWVDNERAKINPAPTRPELIRQLIEKKRNSLMKDEPEIITMNLAEQAEIVLDRVSQALRSAAKDLKIDQVTAERLIDLTIEKMREG